MENTVNNTTVVKHRPTISKTNFKLQASNGLTRTELAKYFGIKESQVSNIAKQLQVKLKRNIIPTINLID